MYTCIFVQRSPMVPHLVVEPWDWLLRHDKGDERNDFKKAELSRRAEYQPGLCTEILSKGFTMSVEKNKESQNRGAGLA